MITYFHQLNPSKKPRPDAGFFYAFFPLKLNHYKKGIMFHYSESSKRHLASCDERLQRVFNKVIQHYDCTIICGHRGKVAQMLAFESGKSELQWPNSNHNALPSKAVDVMAYPLDWFDYQRSAHFAGFVIGIAESMGIKLRWGGDWDGDGHMKDHKFIDYPHFELIDD